MSRGLLVQSLTYKAGEERMKKKKSHDVIDVVLTLLGNGWTDGIRR